MFQFSSDQGSSKIYVYDGQGTNTPLHVLEKLHTKPVCIIRYNVTFDVVVSVDQAGILEYWTGPKQDYKFPSKLVSFESKLDTSKKFTVSDELQPVTSSSSFEIVGLFEFAKNKTIVSGLAFSNDGKKFATLSTDRKVNSRRIFFLPMETLQQFPFLINRFAFLHSVPVS